MDRTRYEAIVPDWTRAEATGLLEELHLLGPTVQAAYHCHRHGWVDDETLEHWAGKAAELTGRIISLLQSSPAIPAESPLSPAERERLQLTAGVLDFYCMDRRNFR